MILPFNYDKLIGKGEPYQFSVKPDPSVHTIYNNLVLPSILKVDRIQLRSNICSRDETGFLISLNIVFVLRIIGVKGGYSIFFIKIIKL